MSDDDICHKCGAPPKQCPCPKPVALDSQATRATRKAKRRKTTSEDHGSATAEFQRSIKKRNIREMALLDYEPTPQSEEERAFRPMPWPIL